MANATVTFDGTRWATADELAPTSPFGGDWDDTGGGAAPLEPDITYQGNYSVSEKVKTASTFLGPGWVPDAALDMNTTKRVFILKTTVTTVGILSLYSSGDAYGSQIEIGSGGRRSSYYRYRIADGTSYPASGGWLITAIDPNLSGHAYATVSGPVSATAINWAAYGAVMTVATAKSENVCMDAIDYVTNGTGLTLVGGDGASSDGTFNDFNNFDEQTNANRYGICTAKDDIYYIVGVLTIGTTTETDFTDSNQTIVFPDGNFDTGFCGVDIGLQNSNSVISLTSITMVGKGESAADGANADTRPDIGITGTSGSATIDACSIQNFNAIVLTSGVTISDTVFLGCNSLTQGNASIPGCTFDGSTVATNTAFMNSDNPADISNSTFISSGTGHAIEITSAGTYTFDGNVFTDYATNAGTAGNRAIRNNTGGTVTLNVTNAVSPSIYTVAGSTTVVNNNVTVIIVVKDTNQKPIEDVVVAIYNSDTSAELFNDYTDTDTAGAFIVDREYKILTVGNTDFTAIGASSNTVGIIFTATGVGSGTGTATSGRISFSSGADINIRIRARKNSPGITRYFPVSTTGNTGANGISLTLTLTEDTIAN